MLSASQIDAVRAMRAAGLTQSVVAARVGVSTRTIQRIDRAHRGARPVVADPDPAWVGKAERCPGCGGMAVIEAGVCRECRAERIGPPVVGRPPDEAGETDPLAIDLRGGARARYLTIRAEKQAEAAAAAAMTAEYLDDLAGPTDAELRRAESRGR